MKIFLQIKIKLKTIEFPISQLIIGYNDYPLYNIKEGRNLVDNYLKQKSNINNNNAIEKIFTYDNSNNFNTFYNTIIDQYKKYEESIANNYLSNLKNETIKNIKKFVSSDPNNTDDINKYILFYNIDFLLKNYIFDSKKQIMYLFKNNKIKFNITGLIINTK